MKITRLVSLIVVSLVAQLGLLLVLALPAEATSCGCLLESDTAHKPALFSDGKACKSGVAADDCRYGGPGLEFDASVTSCTTTYSARADDYITRQCNVVCTPYRDDACTYPVGSINRDNLSSVFNPCWTKDQCVGDGRGVWDTADTTQCNPLGKDAQGNDIKTRRCFVKTPPIPLQIGIPGVTDKVCTDDVNQFCSTNADCQGGGQCRAAIVGGFPGYMAKFYKFFVGFLAVAAVTMMSWGGFKRIMAAGSAERIKDANEAIFQAIIGLVLALLAYSLLNLVNPALVDSTGLKVDRVKTELFGNWCPDKDPVDPNITYQCGDQAVINGSACTGASCSQGTGGCYKIDTTGEKLANGRSKDYQCMQNWEACGKITDSNVTKLFGSTSEQADVHSDACRSFSDKDGQCLWSEKGLPTGGWGNLVPGVGYIAAALSSALTDDQCIYVPKDLIKAVCQGSDFGGKHFSTPSDCHDFNSVSGDTSRTKWTFCYYDLCNLGCWAKWKGAGIINYLTLNPGLQTWWCKNKTET